MTAEELIEMLPEQVFHEIGQATHVDYKVQKLHGKLMFNLLLYGMLEEERLSLRTLEDTFHDPKFKFFFGLQPDSTIRYNSLSDRLATMPVNYFAEIYQVVYHIFSTHYDRRAALKYHIQRVDSTMVCEEARKLQAGMSVGRKKDCKKQIKITLSLTDMFPSSFELFTSQSALSEDIAMPPELFKQVVQGRENTIATFDRGLTSRKVYAQFNEQGKGFVTRLKEKSVYEVLEETAGIAGRVYGNLTYIAQQKVRFTQCKEHHFRLLIAMNEEGQRLLFLSNCWELSFTELIDIYRKRWDIEVFFRFLKQELNLSHLVSMNENGLQIIIYMTLIVAMLLLVYKKKNQYGYKTAKRRFRIELNSYIIALIIESCGGDSRLWLNTLHDVFG